jgi:hypothetical protein
MRQMDSLMPTLNDLYKQGRMTWTETRSHDPRRLRSSADKEPAMLWTIAVILLVLWALGMISSYSAGGLVHLLLVVAVIVVVFQVLGGRRSI